MQPTPIQAAAAAEQAPAEPAPAQGGACEIILFPGFDINMIVQTPGLWNRPVKPTDEPPA